MKRIQNDKGVILRTRRAVIPGRVLAGCLAALLASSSTLPAWAGSANPTNPHPFDYSSPGALYSVSTNNPSDKKTAVGAGGCAQNYSDQINSLTDQSNTKNVAALQKEV